jgi:hypothetical protein
MHDADLISFWFPRETLCPITLYELGKWHGKADKPIVVGMHPDYPRRIDVEEQSKLVFRGNPEFHYSLSALAAGIKLQAKKMADDWNRG